MPAPTMHTSARSFSASGGARKQSAVASQTDTFSPRDCADIEIQNKSSESTAEPASRAVPSTARCLTPHDLQHDAGDIRRIRIGCEKHVGWSQLFGLCGPAERRFAP